MEDSGSDHSEDDLNECCQLEDQSDIVCVKGELEKKQIKEGFQNRLGENNAKQNVRISEFLSY